MWWNLTLHWNLKFQVSAKMKIAEVALMNTDHSDILPSEIREKLVLASAGLSNAREIQRLIKDTISLYEINRICSGLKT